MPRLPLDAIIADPPEKAMAEAQFSAVLTPNRSLSREGLILLFTFFGGINLIGGLFFVVSGAWPVAGFMGADVALLGLAFAINNRAARRFERVAVTAEELLLERHPVRGPVEQRRFTRPWVRVELEEDHERELIGRLLLRCRGETTEIGSFLGADDRKSFAAALGRALRR